MQRTLLAWALGIVALGTLAHPEFAAGQIYKWRDASGRIQFTQTPPPPGATLLDGPPVDKRAAPTKDATPKAISASTVASRGMTWGYVNASDLPPDAVSVGCRGAPALDDLRWAHDGVCNPYRGDTSCSASLPLLCYKADGSSPPPGVAGTDFYNGWAAGSVATTAAVSGSSLTSLQAANEVCRSTLGAGWRMAEFHDGKGGWGFTANGRVNTQSRFWVRINDQPGNCWDSPGASSATPAQR